MLRTQRKLIHQESRGMKAVTPAGRVPLARISLALILASGMVPAQGQEPASEARTSTVDQLELLLREQQSLQTRQTQQLQTLRQRLDDQARVNDLQDWQWTGGLAFMLLLVFALAWLAKQWPLWQQERAARQAQLRTARVKAATDGLINLKRNFEDSGQISGGSEIDHSGPGMLKHLLRRKKTHQAFARSGGKPGRMAIPDEPDSQMLADEAVREYELRRTVGLDEPPEPSPESAKAVMNQQEVDTESAWLAMQEIPLDSPSQAQLEVSVEVQRVRTGLRVRREKRHLAVLQVAEPLTNTDTPKENALEEHAAQMTYQVAHQHVVQTAQEPTDVAVWIPGHTGSDSKPGSLDVALPSVQPKQEEHDAVRLATGLSESASFSVSSLPAYTEAETRLALGYEFQKLGQLDEAALLYEEVLVIGAMLDQTRARKLLSALPYR